MQKMDCPVCAGEAEGLNRGGGPQVTCPKCGQFEIGHLAVHALEGWSPRQRANLSGWIREHQGCKITEPELRRLGPLRSPTIGERADKVLQRLAAWFPKPGTTFSLSTGEPGTTLPLRFSLTGVGGCEDEGELAYLLDAYLVGEKRCLELEVVRGSPSTYRITPTGWAYLDSLNRGNPASQQGFVAMWFDDSMEPVRLAIERGIRNAGYDALRIDQKQHNNEITDEIIAEIRKSKFLVADLTKHRNGVYFEAGFAKGLGLEVIWLCRRDELGVAHFDTRQYNFIVWEPDKLEELAQALRLRIEATLGRGPLQAAT